jgi:hypothetical protein
MAVALRFVAMTIAVYYLGIWRMRVVEEHGRLQRALYPE